MLTILSAACADRQQCAGSGMPLPYNALPIPISCNFTIKTAVLREKPQHGCSRLCAPGERTFYRVKVPSPPGSGKG